MGGGKEVKCVKSNENLGIQDVFVSVFCPVINWMEVVKLYEKTETNAGSLTLWKIKFIYLLPNRQEPSVDGFRERSRQMQCYLLVSLSSTSPVAGGVCSEQGSAHTLPWDLATSEHRLPGQERGLRQASL